MEKTKIVCKPTFSFDRFELFVNEEENLNLKNWYINPFFFANHHIFLSLIPIA
jgi:hypothetical protein